jgi:hypothetical protein
VAFGLVLLAAIVTHWWLAIPWLIVGVPITFFVVSAVTLPVARVLVGGWDRDQEAIGAWLETIPRPQPRR